MLWWLKSLHIVPSLGVNLTYHTKVYEGHGIKDFVSLPGIFSTENVVIFLIDTDVLGNIFLGFLSLLNCLGHDTLSLK